MKTSISTSHFNKAHLFKDINKKADSFINKFLWSYFIIGLIIAFEYDTWFVAVVVGGSCMISYYFSKLLLPESNIYQYVGATVLAIFMGQFIYQMHGMFEMHFFAYVGCTALIAYQNWKLQIPLILTIAIHHGVFAYLQFAGNSEIHFTQLEYMDLRTFIIHCGLAAVIVGICGYWSYINSLKTIKDGEFSIELEERLNGNLEIAKKIENGDYKIQTDLFNESDKLGSALVKMANHIESDQKKLHKNNDQLNSLVYALSHDMKTPIHAINSVSSWIKDDLEEGNYELIKSHVEKLQTSTIHIAEKMNSLRAYLMLDINELKFEKIDFEKLITNITEELKTQHSFKIDTDNFPSILSDKTQLRLLFHHLIENGIVHNESANTEIQLKNKCNEAESLYIIEYYDNGPGMTKNEFNKLTKLFSSLNKNYESLRAGMGLSIIHKILDNLEGDLRYIETTKGLGIAISFKSNK